MTSGKAAPTVWGLETPTVAGALWRTGESEKKKDHPLNLILFTLGFLLVKQDLIK